jgi:hypothetical protein
MYRWCVTRTSTRIRENENDGTEENIREKREVRVKNIGEKKIEKKEKRTEENRREEREDREQNRREQKRDQ